MHNHSLKTIGVETNFQQKKISFSYRLVTLSGLEAALKRELTTINPTFNIGVTSHRGRVEVSDCENPFSDLNSNTVDRFLSDVSLKSRLVQGVRVRFGGRFSGKWEKQVHESLRALPWRLFFAKGSCTPEIQVKSTKSRLFAPSRVRSLVEAAFKEFQGQNAFQQLERIPLGSPPTLGIAPRVFVHVEEDVLQLEVDAGGQLLNRLGLERFASESRLDVCEVSASAITMRSLQKILNKLTEPVVVWDPFCGSGHLVLAAMRTLSGVPPGSPAIEYPFRSFPFHNKTVFADAVGGLRMEPFANSDKIERFYATDSSFEAIEIMRRNVERFRSGLPRTDDMKDVISFQLQVERLPEAYTPPGGKVLVVSALPAKADSERKFKKFNEMVEKLTKENRLRGCVVATSKSHLFRKLSDRNWLTELRFFDGRREVEVLTLV